MIKLNQEMVAKDGGFWKESISTHQAVVYVMCGGGMLGHFAAEQPADFYIDDRVGKLPYPKKQIYQAVETLGTLAKANGLDPHHLPNGPRFHNCGIF